MKRSPLNRRTPMPRSTKPLRRVSRKRARQDRQLDHRKQFRAEHFPCLCWYCGERQATDVDHGLGRPNHPNRHHIAHLIASCNECNVGKVSTAKKRDGEFRQIKMRYDPGNYDEAIWNELMGCWAGG